MTLRGGRTTFVLATAFRLRGIAVERVSALALEAFQVKKVMSDMHKILLDTVRTIRIDWSGAEVRGK